MLTLENLSAQAGGDGWAAEYLEEPVGLGGNQKSVGRSGEGGLYSYKQK